VLLIQAANGEKSPTHNLESLQTKKGAPAKAKDLYNLTHDSFKYFVWFHAIRHGGSCGPYRLHNYRLDVVEADSVSASILLQTKK